MASITSDKKGCRRIQFADADRKRKSFRLGKVSKKQAEAVKLKVEKLVAARITGHPPDDETSRWVADLDDVLADKLARAGLIPKRESSTLKAFIDGYIKRRVNVKPNTTRVWNQTVKHLCEFLGPERPLRSITKGDAQEWQLFLIGKGLAEASVRKHCGFAKHFFNAAVDRELIARNPFASLISSSISNPARQYFVSSTEISKVLEACPDAEWRLIVALSRYGGLRCPSEHLALRWEDVNWQENRIVVQSPKTERYAGHASRVLPIFPELRPYLEDAFEQAEEGAEFVISRYRKSDGNLRSQMTRIVKRAGLKPWPRIFHNLRASRQTELEEDFPTHVVCSWIGNSPDVARRHYLQVTEEHFQKAAQNAAQYPAVTGETGRDFQNPSISKTPRKQGDSASYDAKRNSKTGVDGNRTHQVPFQGPRRV